MLDIVKFREFPAIIRRCISLKLAVGLSAKVPPVYEESTRLTFANLMSRYALLTAACVFPLPVAI